MYESELTSWILQKCTEISKISIASCGKNVNGGLFHVSEGLFHVKGFSTATHISIRDNKAYNIQFKIPHTFTNDLKIILTYFLFIIIRYFRSIT